jgi:amino acid transporter
VLGVLLVLEIVLLVILAVSILSQRAGQLEFGTFAPENIFTPSMFAILGFGFAAFMGFESTVLYRSETRDPERSIPRATYIAVAFLAIFYTGTLWLVIQAFGDAAVQGVIAEDPAAFFFIAMGTYVGEWGISVMFVLIVSSIFAGQLAFHNAINRNSFALSRDSILPALFNRTNRMGAPWVAGLIEQPGWGVPSSRVDRHAICGWAVSPHRDLERVRCGRSRLRSAGLRRPVGAVSRQLLGAAQARG